MGADDGIRAGESSFVASILLLSVECDCRCVIARSSGAECEKVVLTSSRCSRSEVHAVQLIHVLVRRSAVVGFESLFISHFVSIRS